MFVNKNKAVPGTKLYKMSNKRQRTYASSSRASSSSSKGSDNPFANGYNNFSVPPLMKAFKPNLRTMGYIGLEKKFIDYTKGLSDIDWRLSHANHSPGTVGCLNAIAAGDGPTERDGRKCTLLSLHLNGCLMFRGDATDGRIGQARLLIIVDTQTNKTQLTNLGEVLHNSTSSNEEDLHVYLFRNLGSTKRFRILYDKSYVFNPNYDSYLQQKNFKINLNLKNLVTNYDSSSSNGHVNTILDNAIYVFAISDLAETSTAKVKIEYNSRIRFVG